MRIGGVGMTDEGSTIGVDVENIGDRRGSAVVFAFGGLPDSEVVRPLRRLIGFARVDLAAGESVRAGLDLDWSQLDVRRDETWWTEPGDYVVTVGLDASDHAHVVPVVR